MMQFGSPMLSSKLFFNKPFCCQGRLSLIALCYQDRQNICIFCCHRGHSSSVVRRYNTFFFSSSVVNKSTLKHFFVKVIRGSPPPRLNVKWGRVEFKKILGHLFVVQFFDGWEKMNSLNCLVVRWLDGFGPRETWLSDNWKLMNKSHCLVIRWLIVKGQVSFLGCRMVEPLLGFQMVGWLRAEGDSTCLVVRWLDGW